MRRLYIVASTVIGFQYRDPLPADRIAVLHSDDR